MNKLEQGYLDGFIKAATGALGEGFENMVHPMMQEDLHGLDAHNAQRLSGISAGNEMPMNPDDFAGINKLMQQRKPNFLQQAGTKLNHAWNNPKSNTLGDMSLRKATGIGLGAGAAAHLGGQAAGALTSNIGNQPSDLPQRVQSAAQSPEMNPANLYQMLKQHLAKHELGYGVGAGALGLGGLGYYLNKKKNHHKEQDDQIPFNTGEDEPGVENVD